MNILKLLHHPNGLADLRPDQLEAQLTPPSVIIDVRTPREYASGHIPGAISVPLGQEQTLESRWPVETAVVLICKTGHRSQAAAATLLQLGYRQVSHLKGGMDAWRRAGGPTES